MSFFQFRTIQLVAVKQFKTVTKLFVLLHVIETVCDCMSCLLLLVMVVSMRHLVNKDNKRKLPVGHTFPSLSYSHKTLHKQVTWHCKLAPYTLNVMVFKRYR